VLLALHCRRLGEDSLGGWVYMEQLARGWPGLAKEASDICEKLGIESCDVTTLSKGEYRKTVTAACHKLNQERLRDQSRGKQKCVRIVCEEYEMKTCVK
jgi:hypothetical protein